MVTIYRNDKVVGQSKNLRGIRRRKNRLAQFMLSHRPNGRGEFCIEWVDGAHAIAYFAHYSVMCDWIRRWRKAQGARLIVQGVYVGKVHKNNDYLTGLAQEW